MPSFAKTFNWVSYSSTLTNKNAELQEKVCWFYIYLKCFAWHNKLSIFHSIKRKCKFINIDKNFEIFLPNLMKFCSHFWQIESFWGACEPPAHQTPTPLIQCTRRWSNKSFSTNRITLLLVEKDLYSFCYNFLFYEWSVLVKHERKTLQIERKHF